MDELNQLFALSPTARWENTCKWLKNRKTLADRCDKIVPELWGEVGVNWPTWCTGSINAWLLFVGASRGNSPPVQNEITDFQEMVDFRPVIGKSHPGIRCPDKTNYWNRVREITITFFSQLGIDEVAALSLMHHANLLPKNAGRQPSFGELKEGAPRFLYVFKHTRSRCIIAMTKNVLRVIEEAIPHQVMKSRSFQYGRYKPTWQVWKLQSGEQIFVARPPNHPVRHGWKYLPEFAIDVGLKAGRELNLLGKDDAFNNCL